MSYYLLVSEFDLKTGAYTGVNYSYPMNQRAGAIGDFIMFSPKRGLVIERDGSQGNLNGFKAIYEVEINGEDEPFGKRLAVDLLDISDPDLISEPGLEGDIGIGEDFAFPFVTIESVVVLDDETIGVLNDNNYPFSIGRHVGQGLPDDTEFIILSLGRPLGVASIDKSGSLFLVDTEENKDIQRLPDSVMLSLPMLPELVDVRAEFYGEEVKSVVFYVDGEKEKVDNHAPYTLYDEGMMLPAGTYEITAIPFSQANGEGVAGKPVMSVIEVVPGMVTGFTLVNADTDEDIAPITDGIQVSVTDLPTLNLNIRADVDSETIGSVVFDFNDQMGFRTENSAPFALAGDNNGDYFGFTPPIGMHTVKATPYSEENGEGTAGKVLSVTFEILDCEVDGGTIATDEAQTIIFTCAGDSVADLVTFSHDSNSEATYGYIVTDDKGEVLALPMSNEVDFDGAGTGTCRIYGVSYTGTFTIAAGSNISGSDLSDGCAELSENFIAVVRQECGISSVANLRYYPNPAKNSVAVEFEQYPYEKVAIQVVDVFGRQLISGEHPVLQPNGSVQLDVSSVKKGVYLMQVVSPKAEKAIYRLYKE
ncbi:esterase-like activity of phytase family protein [Tunicatimonas pelagia]|uniref:esterase-like activity of phytase family protein n=1 Tax=Tunicatimonas pelagia TaxID=931531 RepID=UPI00266611DD|nr:esterase-like activity of phytase family protein [Tunicatimonas pelagia]WKN44573.1 esterase-like activity of phytase family protein [Tunicatimonas pelagia]